MKALIVVKEEAWGWMRGFFDGTHPSMVPICNKPILEYMLDFTILAGAEKVRMVLEEPCADVEAHFGNGSLWGVEIDYGECRKGDGVDRILYKNSAFRGDGALLVLDGLFFINYDKRENLRLDGTRSESGLIKSCRGGYVLHMADRGSGRNIVSAREELPFSLSPLSSLEDIARITRRVLGPHRSRYVLPGYGEKRGVLTGRNVLIDKDAVLIPPVVVGDDTSVFGNAVIGPFAVLGKEVVIGEGSRVTNSIVMPGTQVGRNLHVDKKIVDGKRVIAMGDTAPLVIEEPRLFSRLPPFRLGEKIRYAADALGGLLLGLMLLLPYLVLGAAGRTAGMLRMEKKPCVAGASGDSASFNFTAYASETFFGKLFSALHLDRFPRIKDVLRGRLRLVGNRLLEDTPANRRLAADFPEYRPGLFAFTEGEDLVPGSMEAVVAERFYSGRQSFLDDLALLVRTLFSRRRPES